ncbi:MAG: glycosyltransferase [Bacteroidetes bacterium]|nr:glycosyltransferase [Bacteroidota bacterium]
MPEILFFLPFFLLFHSYVLYPVLVWAFATSGRNRKSDSSSGIDEVRRLQPDKDSPLISVLIAAYNEEKVIGRTLACLLNSKITAGTFEIIVGSDNSKDKTGDIVTAISAEHPNVKYFHSDKRRGKTGILNWISKEAKGEILVFCDSNMMFDENALQRLAENFYDKRVGGVSGEIHLQESFSGNQEGSYWSFESWLKAQEGSLGKLIGANGGIYAMRKDLYFEYPEGVPLNDDFVTCMKVLGKGFKFNYDRGAFALEEPSPSNEDEFKRKKRIQISNLGSLRFLSEFWFPFRSVAAFFLWSHKILRWMTPFLLIIMFAGVVLNTVFWNFYSFILVAILASWVMALVGLILGRRGIKSSPFLLFYYFYGTITAFLFGTFTYFTMQKTSTWEPTRRS